MREGLSRRTFLAASGAASVAALAGCGAVGGPPTPSAPPTTAWRLSTRKVSSASNAAKLHAANKRFVSQLAADQNRAHPGDRSRIVRIDVSPATWQLWFGRGDQVVDLRRL